MVKFLWQNNISCIGPVLYVLDDQFITNQLHATEDVHGKNSMIQMECNVPIVITNPA